MRKSLLHSIIALVLELIILLPFTIQIFHSLEHKHEICTADNIQHLHEKDLDCIGYHSKIEQNSLHFTAIQLEDLLTVIRTYDHHYYIKNYQKTSERKKSRAPPYFIV